MAFEMKKHDQRPRYRIQLTQSDPNNATAQIPVDLTAATSAVFIMSSVAGVVKVNRGVMSFIDRVNGIVEYAWAAGDTDTSGTYNIEIEVLWGTEPQTFPSKGYFTATISDDLG
jgi:hypothetical protein